MTTIDIFWFTLEARLLNNGIPKSIRELRINQFQKELAIQKFIFYLK